ncbi:MAG: DUF3375 domain-containing protein [Bryobacterales bacterium]|nr:DUF3375 domain-containing protein [Bryobacterales bacterium]
MSLAFDTLANQIKHHPGWRLLRSDNAPLVVSFLHQVYIERNQRVLAESDLAEALEDQLYNLRERMGEEAFPKSALEYLSDWAHTDRSWLRKFYVEGSDEPHYDLMPATEKAIAWLGSLSERKFVGTESRLLTLFDLLRQINAGAEEDPAKRIKDLQRQKRAVESEIERVRQGDMRVLDPTALKDRFQQFMQMSRDLLTDFREVEQNFRTLDRQTRERIALWEGPKKDVLGEVLGRRDAIIDTDQGRSFLAFWDFLMSQSHRDEFSSLLDSVLELAPIKAMDPQAGLRNVHHEWLKAGGHTQQTVRSLSHQLRRFLDDRVQLENRRIMEILHRIEKRAIDLRYDRPDGIVAEIPAASADISLPMERPLWQPSARAKIREIKVDLAVEDLDAAALYEQVFVDKKALADHIRLALQEQAVVTLPELCELRPLEQGLAELLAYLQLAAENPDADVDDDVTDSVSWQVAVASGQQIIRKALIPRVTFAR